MNNGAPADPITPRGSAHVPRAGNTLRFALLLCLLLVSSTSIAWSTASGLLHPGSAGTLGCRLAAGTNPEGNLFATYLPTLIHSAAYRACIARYGGWTVPSPLWGAAAAPLLAVAASALYWVLPAWKARRGRMVPVEDADPGGTLRQVLAELTASAGLTLAPRFVIDPAAATTSAVVFGRPPRHIVCLHGGLIARRGADAAGFRAVILHELAHIRNRDVGITYATVALWRTYVLALLLPYVAVTAVDLFSSRHGAASTAQKVELLLDIHGFVLSALLVVLVYLVRADLLRTREILADREAANRGAEAAGWSRGPAPAPRRTALAWSRFASLWRTHPSWQQRRRSLTDPAALFSTPSLQMFLTGAAIAAISDRLSTLAGAGQVMETAATWCTAGLAATVTTVTLWRAVSYQVLNGLPVRSGLAAGLSLGAGTAAGGILFSSALDAASPLPGRPAFVLPVPLAAVVIAQWLSEYAALSVRASRRGRAPASMLAALVTVWLVFVAVLEWWQTEGRFFANGWPLASAGQVSAVTGGTGQTLPGHSGLLTAITAGVEIRTGFGVLAVSALLLWTLPALAWFRRPAGSGRWRAHALASGGGSPWWGGFPSYRPVVLTAVAAGAAGCALAAGAMAYMHSWHTPVSEQRIAFMLIYVAWLTVALMVGAVAAALIASLVVRAYPLLSALVAAGSAVTIGAGGVFVLAATNGCAGPLTTLTTSCRWRPAEGLVILGMLSPYVAGLGVITAAVAALPAATLPAATLPGAVRRAAAKLRPAKPRRPAPAAREHPVALRAVAALLCGAGIALTGVAWLFTSSGAPGTSASAIQPVAGTWPAIPPPPPDVLAWQMASWFEFGGRNLIQRFLTDDGLVTADVKSLATALARSPASTTFRRAAAPMRPVCAGIARTAREAKAYFPVPDRRGQRMWSAVLAHERKASADCLDAVRQASQARLISMLDDITGAYTTGTKLMKLFSAQAPSP